MQASSSEIDQLDVGTVASMYLGIVSIRFSGLITIFYSQLDAL